MEFMGHFFHQIKCTAMGTPMGTPMAVNFANFFMSRFENKLLQDYEKQTGLKPALWQRFIDDIFLVWVGDEKGLKHFLTFCNNFHDTAGYSSKIMFTYSHSPKSVSFLDTLVTLEKNGVLSTNLYPKPTASHFYLHYSSYHNPHVIKSLPNSQLMRIFRICTYKADYWKHAKAYINFFVE